MHIVFASSVLNHHSLPLCLALSGLPEVTLSFVAGNDLSEERISLGYRSFNNAYDFVIRAYESEQAKEQAITACNECDVLIYGSAPYELVKARLGSSKLTFRYSERVYKTPCPWYQIPLRAMKYNRLYGRNKNLYLLCASAYTAADYAKTRTFLNRAFKWGYFPSVTTHENISEVIKNKKRGSLLWCGRMISWKHPEHALEVAKRLAASGHCFELNMIGTGPEEDALKKRIKDEGLEAFVHILGAMPPEQVRRYMEESSVYLFTSDRQEGWGAVLNESMNSACAVVASHAIGAVPFLIKGGKNGLIYRDGDLDDLYRKTKELLDSPTEAAQLGARAYETMVGEWNADVAAKKLLLLIQGIQENKLPDLDPDGVCGKAPLLCDSWYPEKSENR